MDTSYFDLLDVDGAGAHYLAGPETGGPWAAELQHGGPPNALLVAEAERVAAAETGRADLLAVRLAAEFVGPVPVAAVHTQARIVRSARSALLVEATLRAGGRECLHARIWLVAGRDTARIAAPLPEPVEPPTGTSPLNMRFPYGDSVQWRAVRGNIDQPGPGIVWARPRLELLEGRAMSGLQRAALIGDSASGISSVLDWHQWSFLNVDLDVHLSRPVIGDWLHMDAATTLGPTGSGLARSTLADVCGPVGSTLQTLVVAPARRE
ncbi:MAG: thioesterase family protein [Actinomycetota bacterium]|nr:thioesterase family protein [Actinomycetota bacterium]